MENCRIVELTVDAPWSPSDVFVGSLSGITDMEATIMREIHSLGRTNGECQACRKGKLCECTSSNLATHNDATLLTAMIGMVKVATASRGEVNISFVGAKDRHSQVNAETVAKRFRCGIETAQKTLKATTQRGVRQAIHPLHRRYRVDHLDLNRKRLNDTFYMDTLFSKVKSLAGFTCAQLITNGTFTRVYPMESKSGA
jgi:hypothetical protein